MIDDEVTNVAYIEETTLIAYFAFTIFFLVAYKLSQISLVTLVICLVSTAVLAVVFYLLVQQYWPVH
ncbi:hypothetical protein [Brevibacillus reuszeri]|uniref:Uncharacterized protein n=1 Tax=Brevibacillus reuszeri TaxID=54915 RepID=A0A0K9YKI5_9BACL|nr:hypothetical protein [Brevibacillus reuszeri]KNB69162.1 hypothetical protein ADS79_24875 [Brevibacillus reuszeri]MED1860093.1 hypothetical protein [Brevibacillus reuszeri]